MKSKKSSLNMDRDQRDIFILTQLIPMKETQALYLPVCQNFGWHDNIRKKPSHTSHTLFCNYIGVTVQYWLLLLCCNRFFIATWWSAENHGNKYLLCFLQLIFQEENKTFSSCLSESINCSNAKMSSRTTNIGNFLTFHNRLPKNYTNVQKIEGK